MNNAFHESQCAWIDCATSNDYVVVSCRIRLARNLVEWPFPSQMREVQGVDVQRTVTQALQRINGFQMSSMQTLSQLNRVALVEKHLISPKLAQDEKQWSAVAINAEGNISVMINEEDHLRIQGVWPGLSLQTCWKQIKQLDNDLEQSLTYAFDEELGYLTSCPTNIGTGMRASVMLHLPALSYTRNISKALGALSQVGFVARGLYGEGSEVVGHMYQVSNQITLGLSEEEIITNLQSVTAKLVEQEQKAREFLMHKHRLAVEDKIGRAYGVLLGARQISTQEAMKFLSYVRMGAHLKMVVPFSPAFLNKLMVDIQPASLQRLTHEKLENAQRDETRATILRQRLKLA